MWILIIVKEHELEVWLMMCGFRREAEETCAVLHYCAVYSGNFLPTFRDNLSVVTSTALMFVKTSLSD